MSLPRRQSGKIHTEFVYPPIPDRSFDWSATFEGYDGAPIDYDTPSRDLIGRGPTELAAIADLLQQERDRHEEDDTDLIKTLVDIATLPYKQA